MTNPKKHPSRFEESPWKDGQDALPGLPEQENVKTHKDPRQNFPFRLDIVDEKLKKSAVASKRSVPGGDILLSKQASRAVTGKKDGPFHDPWVKDSPKIEFTETKRPAKTPFVEPDYAQRAPEPELTQEEETSHAEQEEITEQAQEPEPVEEPEAEEEVMETEPEEPAEEEPAEEEIKTGRSGDDALLEHIRRKVRAQEDELDDLLVEDHEKEEYSKPKTIMEVFMAAKKKGGGVGKKPSAASVAMGDALSKQERSSETIERMVDKNIAAETSRTAAEKKAAKPLADIVGEMVKKKEKEAVASKPAPKIRPKAAPKARPAAAKSKAKAKAPAAPPKARKPKVRKAAAPGYIPIENLGEGLALLLGDAFSGTLNVGRSVGSAVVGGAKSVAVAAKSAAAKVSEKVSGSAKSVKKKVPKAGKTKKGEKGSIPAAGAAAARTASKVTGKVASGMATVVSEAAKVAGRVVGGVATVAGYTVKGGVAIVSDSVNGVLNIVASFTGKKKKAA